MDCKIVRLFTHYRSYVLIVLLAGMVGVGLSEPQAYGALLDGAFGGFEESMGQRASNKGERLVIGNFYQAERPDSHGPIGVMGDHTHNKGEFMFTYRYMAMFMDKNRDGTDNVSNNDVLDDFVITPTEMTTRMHMFSAMYGLTDTVTVMAMLPYVIKSMDHRNRMGVKFTTESSGFGDAKVVALWRLYAFETPSIGSHRFHFNTGLSLPTGDIAPRDHTPLGKNSLLPYPMRLGSGTVDFLPGLTYAGNSESASWGVQGLGTVRIGKNDRGYALGDAYQFTAWGAYKWGRWVSNSLRVLWKQWFDIEGRDGQLATRAPNGAPLVPTAEPDLRAGRRLDILAGLNVLFPEVMGLENHVNVEVGIPVYQNLDGPQLRQLYSAWLGWQIIY